jgi:hypothetical protein
MSSRIGRSRPAAARRSVRKEHDPLPHPDFPPRIRFEALEAFREREPEGGTGGRGRPSLGRRIRNSDQGVGLRGRAPGRDLRLQRLRETPPALGTAGARIRKIKDAAPSVSCVDLLTRT